MNGPIAFHVLVSASRTIGDAIGELCVAAADGDRLPDWQPGAHVELSLPSGRQRSYSICSELTERRNFRFLLRRSGTSDSAFDEVTKLATGTRIEGRLRPSAFPVPGPGDRILIVCGGIGVTPMLSIAEAARAVGANVEAVHFISGERDSPLATILARVLPPDRLRVHFGGRPAGAASILEDVMQQVPCGTVVYSCGPASLMQSVMNICQGRNPPLVVYRESFDLPLSPTDVEDEPFQVRLEGHTDWITVPPGRSLLSVLEGLGLSIPSSCRRGICGTCMVWVKDGVPLHRDNFLTEAARSGNRCMLSCVSRARSGRLVIEL